MLWHDPAGDIGRGVVDFRTLGASVGADGLSIYLEAAASFRLATSTVRIELDTDGNPATGTPRGGLGVDLSIDFSPAQTDLRFYPATATLFPSLVSLPIHEVVTEILPTGLNAVSTHPSSNRHEILLPLSALPGVTPGGRIGILLRDGLLGDYAPDLGQTWHADVPAGLLVEDAIPSLDRIDPDDIRIASFNVLVNGPADPDKEPGFSRLLRATQPDIINFQEMAAFTEIQARDLVAQWLPLPEGEQWYARKNSDCITVSRFPIRRAWAIDGNLIAWISTSGVWGFDTVIVNAHTPAHEENQGGRLIESDKFMLEVRQLLAGTHPLGYADPCTVLVIGDLNANAPKFELTTARAGRFFDNSRRPLNFWPDAYARPLVDAAPRHTHTRKMSTWRSLDSGNTQRLDYIYYQESRLTRKRAYAVETADMPAAFRTAHGLQPDDARVSDHLLLIADFQPRAIAFAWLAADHLVDGWFHSRWFGPVYRYGGGFHHHPVHGELFPMAGEHGVWCWDPQLGWWYTHAAIHPFAWRAADADWIYFHPGADGARMYYTFDSGTWMQ